jgi:hypothetical protein
MVRGEKCTESEVVEDEENEGNLAIPDAFSQIPKVSLKCVTYRLATTLSQSNQPSDSVAVKLDIGEPDRFSHVQERERSV